MAGYTNCGGACRDLDTDRLNCGTCGTDCTQTYPKDTPITLTEIEERFGFEVGQIVDGVTLWALRGLRETSTVESEELAQQVAVVVPMASALDVVEVSLEQGTDVFHLLLVHFENGAPIQVEDRHILAEFAPGCADHDFGSITPGAYLTSIAPLQEAEQVVRAQLPNATVRRHLRMPENEPCLVVMRRTWAHGRPVTFARLHHPGSRYELTGHYTPPGTSTAASDDVVQLENLQR